MAEQRTGAPAAEQAAGAPAAEQLAEASGQLGDGSGAERAAGATAEPATGASSARGRTVFVTALVGLLALAIGFGAGILIAQPRYPGDNSPEAGFARDMSIHHAQAVSMGIEEYRATQNAPLESMSVDIALTQQAQIGMMQTWLKNWGLESNSSARPMAWMGAAVPEGELMPGMADEASRTKLRNATGKDKDILFCQLMIKHHLGGIHMVDGILSRTDDAQVRELAESMKNGQQYEIAELTKILASMGAKP